MKEKCIEIAWFIVKAIIVLVVVAGLSAFLYYILNQDAFRLKGVYKDLELSLEYNLYYYLAITIVTTGVAIIAWVQLSKLHNSSQVNYLLEFDKKWGSEELIIARALIHQSYVRHQTLNNQADMYYAIGSDIIQWSQSSSQFESSKNFMYVLSLLNFFEGVGFVYNQTHLKAAKIDQLMGQSINFYYKAFELYIVYRRNKHGDDNFHKEFEKIFESL